jgi:L-ascorbate metabolism protein UlaG (beta-lactamase superfamily)
MKALRVVVLVLNGLVTLSQLSAYGVDRVTVKGDTVEVIPVYHASLGLRIGGRLVLADPAWETNRYVNLTNPILILITHSHRDHFDLQVLRFVVGKDTWVVAPPDVTQKLPQGITTSIVALSNGQSTNVQGMTIFAVPMYNVTPERFRFHPRGVGNGYVLQCDSARIYISGDTEDIPEMLELNDIDIAFVCMDGQYTMNVEQAARAVRTFKPRIVYPYHYRNASREEFQKLVGKDSGVEVRIMNWYPVH